MVSFALVTALPVRALADEESSSNVLTTSSSVEVDLSDGAAYYTFTPTESGFYTFSLTATAASDSSTFLGFNLADELADELSSYLMYMAVVPEAGETATTMGSYYLTAGGLYSISAWIEGSGSADSIVLSVSCEIDITETGSYTHETNASLDCVDTFLVYTAATTGAYTVSATASSKGSSFHVVVYAEDLTYIGSCAANSDSDSYTIEMDVGETVYLHFYAYSDSGTTVSYTASVTLDEASAEDTTDDATDATEDEETSDATGDATSNSTDESDEETTDEETTDDSTSDDATEDDATSDSTSEASGTTNGSAGGSAGSGSAGGNAAGGGLNGSGNSSGGAGFAKTGDAAGMVAAALALAAMAALAAGAVALRRRAVR